MSVFYSRRGRDFCPEDCILSMFREKQPGEQGNRKLVYFDGKKYILWPWREKWTRKLG